MSKHTPGPWRCRIAPYGEKDGAPIVQRGTSGGFSVLDHDIKRANADARLIAAAPELYEALEAITKRLEFKNSDEAKHYSSDDSPWLEVARAALAKVES
jgi:hypothetical protein